MTTLHCCTSQGWGGLELYACTTMIELQKRGWKVWALCYPGSKVEGYLKAHGVLVMNLPAYSKFSVSSFRFFRSLLSDEEISVVHVHFHHDLWLASLAMQWDHRRKLVVSLDQGMNLQKGILQRFVCRRVNCILSPSKVLSDDLAERYPASAEKIHHLPYGRRAEEFKADETKRKTVSEKFGIKPGEVVVGTVIRIDPAECVMDVVRSYSFLPEEVQRQVRYLLVGEPTRKQMASPQESPFDPSSEEYFFKIKEYIKSHGLTEKIFLCGSQSDMIGYLNAMDIFVYAGSDEHFSLALLDAMAMKIPVITASATGQQHLVTGNVSGRFFKAGDSKALADTLTLYIKDKAMRNKHGNSAREFVVEHHEMGKTIDRLLEYYRE